MKHNQPQSSCKLRCCREKFKAQLSGLLKFADEISQQAAFPANQLGLYDNCNRWLAQAKTLMTDSFTSDYFFNQMIAKEYAIIDNGEVSNLCQAVRLQAEYLRGLEAQINSIPVCFCCIIHNFFKNLFGKKTMIFITFLTLLFGFTTNAWASNQHYNMKEIYMPNNLNSWTTKDANYQLDNVDGNQFKKEKLYLPANTDFEFKIYAVGTNYEEWWGTNSGTTINTSGNYDKWDWWKDYNCANLTIHTQNATSGYVAVNVEFWGNYSNNSVFMHKSETAVSSLSASLKATTSSLTSGGTTTVTPGCSGGSGSYTYTYKVMQGSTDVTSTTFNSSTKTFTAPTVEESTTYTITVTAKDAHALLSDLSASSKSVTITVTPVSYTVTFGPKSGCETMGSVMAKVDNNGITSGSSVYGGKSVVFSYNANAGYKFTKWVNASGTQLGTGTTYTISSLAKDEKVYAEFAEIQYTITMKKNRDAAGTITPNSQQTLNYFTPIALSYTTNTGYTFSQWSSSTENVEIFDDNGTTKMRIKSSVTVNGTATVTANYNENDIIVNVAVASGDENKGSVTSSSVTAHPETGVTITAEPKAGYYFTGWTSENGDIKFTNKNNASTTIKTTTTGTVVAHFAGKYAFRGSLNDGQDTPGGMPGWSTTTPIDFVDGTAIVTCNELQANKQYKFQLYNLKEKSWVGYQDNTNPIPLNDNTFHSFNGTQLVKLNTQGAGSYQFDIAFEGTTPKVKVTGPTSYQITFGKGTGGNTISASSSIDGAITNNQYVKSGANVTFSQTAATGYHFVEWNTQADGQGTQLGTNETLVLSNVTENKTVYSIYAKTDYNITYPSGTNYTIEKTKEVANYQDNITFKATPKDGYRLEVTAKDASSKSVTLSHNDFSYDYSFSMPASNVTISVTEYPYKIGGNFVNGGGSTDFDPNKYDFDENHQHTFTLNAQTSYKFKIYNENYKGQNDHYMGMEGNWDIDHTTLNSEVTCAGAACFVIKTGIAGQYTIKVKTGANNKPVVDIIYPNVSKLVYNGTDYPFTEVSSGVYTAGPLSLAANTTLSNNIQMYWEGTCIKNDNNSTMSASSHTDWGMVRYTEGTYYIKITTNTTEFAKSPDNYYFYYKPAEKKLSAEYPSYWRGTGLDWTFNYPMEFVNDVATLEYNVTTSGTKEMKVVVDGQYWSKNQEISTSTNDIQFEKDADGKMSAFKYSVASSMTGTYTFTFNRSNHQMSVNYPDTEQFEITYTDAEGTKTIMAGPHGGRGISAANKPGYRFTGWVISPDNTYLTVADNDLSRQTTTVYGKKDGGSLTATYSNDEFIYFKNIPGWSNVNVYFYSEDYFDKDNGSGCLADKDENKRKAYGWAMTHIPNTDIWYLDYKGMDRKPNANIVAFSDHLQNDYQWFNECQVAYRKDFSTCTPMYMPVNWIHERLCGGKTAYYEQGCWMKFDNQESGYEVKLYDRITDGGTEMASVDLTADGAGGYVFTGTININFEGKSEGWNYGFKIKNKCNSTYFGNNGTMTSSNCTNWEFNSASDMQNCGLTTTTKGNYTFTISFDGGIMHVSVEYPVSNGDYRVVYKEGANEPIWNGFYYKKSATDRKDMASFFIKNGVSATVELQRGTNVSADPAVWEKVADINTSSLATGVYNFEVSQTNAGANATIENKGIYSGDFYIRTDGVDGGWKAYATHSDNKMTGYGSLLDAGVTYNNFQYNYYKTKWIDNGKNVKFCIANDYSKNISSEFTTDATLGGEVQTLPQEANVRFMWNSKTNQLKRAYLSGSTNTEDRYLVLEGDEKMLLADGSAIGEGTEENHRKGLHANELPFEDKNNWVYQADIKAQPGCAVKLTAAYNGNVQYFIGKADGEGATKTIIKSSTEGSTTKYTMRVVYDFKTNLLVAGWVPSNTEITEKISLGGDMLISRTHQGDAQQITFGDNGSIEDIHHIYGVLTIEKGQMKDVTNANYAKTMYWISFPFNVKISEIFGVDGYGQKWIMQKYRGDLRAQKGWFKEDTPTFWEFMDASETLNAYEGYLFLIDANYFNTDGADVWKNSATEANFYFPSASGNIGIISADSYPQIVLPHECKIDREFEVQDVGTVNHKNTDSHWNVIGVPAFQNASGSVVEGNKDFKSFYEWNSTTNGYNVRATADSYEFKTMYAYMTQFYGTINWENVSVVTTNSAPRYAYADEKNYMIELFFNGNGAEDHTYINLVDEASTDFVLNEDMMKIDNAGFPNIYSFAGNYNVAYNETKMDNQTVTLGVSAPKAGTYTFAMPKDFSGTAKLIDLVEGITTDLNVANYSVDLNKGTYNNRFQLILEVEAKAPTSIEGSESGMWNEDGKTKKLLINDQIYLINGGRVYNANGAELR